LLDLLRSLLNQKDRDFFLIIDGPQTLKQRMRQMRWEEKVKEITKCSHDEPSIRRMEKPLTA